MFGDGRLACPVDEPFARRVGVGQHLLRGEGLGSDDEQGSLYDNFFQCVDEMAGVHIGYEVHGEAGMAVGAQRFARHVRAEVGSTDADVHDVRDRLARVALPLAPAHGVAEVAHVGQHAIDLRHHVAAIHQHRRVGAVAQRRVQNRATLSGVDACAGEHFPRPRKHTSLHRQLHQQSQRFVVDAVFGIVDVHAIEAERQTCGSLRVAGEQLAQGYGRHGLAMFVEFFPALETLHFMSGRF